MIPMAEKQHQQFTTKPKVKQKSSQPWDPKSPLHPQNFRSNYGQASSQIKSEPSNFISDCESLSSGHGQPEKNFSTAHQTILLTKDIDLFPSVYALPLSCSGNQSKNGCEFPSVIPPPKLNGPTSLGENIELYYAKCESSNVISDSESVSSGLCQSERDFPVACLTLSSAKDTDFIPSVYALPISFSVANQTSIACDVPSVIPPPSLNALIVNQTKELSEMSDDRHLDLMQQKSARQVDAGSSNINESQIEKSHKTSSEVSFRKDDDIPLTQSPELFLNSKVIGNGTESSSCDFVLPSPKDCDNKSFSFPDKTIFQNYKADIPTPRAYDESSTFRDQENSAITILPPKHFNITSVLPTEQSCLDIDTQYKFEHVINQTTNLSISKTKKQRKCVAKNASIETCDLFSGDYLNSLIELGAMSLNNSVNEPNSCANDKLYSDISLQFVSDKTNCDSTVFTTKSNEDALSETTSKGYREQYFNSCYFERHKSAYSVECIKNIDGYEQNPNLYLSVEPKTDPHIWVDQAADYANSREQASEDQQSIALVNDSSYHSNKPKAKISRSDSFPHNHSNAFKLNATLEDKITIRNNAHNKLFFKMPSKSIDSGLGSLSQENLTLSSSDIPSIVPESEKLVYNPVEEQVSYEDEDKFSALLQKCAFDDEDLSEMERIDNLVDNFFGLNSY